MLFFILQILIKDNCLIISLILSNLNYLSNTQETFINFTNKLNIYKKKIFKDKMIKKKV